MKTLVTSTLIVLLLGLGVWWEVFRYGECKKVGHSTLYCVLSAGK